MPIEISGTTVIDDSRNITDVENVGDANTVYYGSGANLTGIQAGSSTFTASGTIPNGSPVIVNSNGTVSVPTESAVEPPTVGSSTWFNPYASAYTSAVYDPTNQKVVVAYSDWGNSNYGTAVVGTVSGTSISFGTPVVFESNLAEAISATYDSVNEKVVIAYRTSVGTQARAIVGTISGTSISFGTFTGFVSSSTSISATYDSANEKVVIAFRNNPSSNRGHAIVGTVSGTSISFGTSVQFEPALTYYVSAVYDSTNGKVVIAYTDGGNSDYGTAVVGTVSGTSISFGTPVVFNSGTTYDTQATYDSTNGKVVVIYRDAGVSPNRGTAIVGTVSGTSISFGSEVTYNNALTSDMAITDATNGRVAIAYKDAGNSNYGTAIVGTVSGTSISFGSEVVFNSATTIYIKPIYTSDGKVVISYRDGGTSNYGRSTVITVSSSTASNDNFIGLAAEAISSGASGSVTIVGGINASQSGLTIGKKYYVQADGTLGTNVTSVEAGISISATQISVGA